MGQTPHGQERREGQSSSERSAVSTGRIVGTYNTSLGPIRVQYIRQKSNGRASWRSRTLSDDIFDKSAILASFQKRLLLNNHSTCQPSDDLSGDEASTNVEIKLVRDSGRENFFEITRNILDSESLLLRGDNGGQRHACSFGGEDKREFDSQARFPKGLGVILCFVRRLLTDVLADRYTRLMMTDEISNILD